MVSAYSLESSVLNDEVSDVPFVFCWPFLNFKDGLEDFEDDFCGRLKPEVFVLDVDGLRLGAKPRPVVEDILKAGLGLIFLGENS